MQLKSFSHSLPLLLLLNLVAFMLAPTTYAQPITQSQQLLQEKNLEGTSFRQVPSALSGELPPTAVLGGYEANGAPLYLCSGIYAQGIHPGKVVAGNCNIGWGGDEILIPPSRYVVITNPVGTPFQWVSSAQGTPLPTNPVATGSEDGVPLYVCRAPYNSGIHPGKVVAGNCNFGWGGYEVVASQYEVLTVGGTSLPPVEPPPVEPPPVELPPEEDPPICSKKPNLPLCNRL